jgi:zinc protease
MTLRRKIAPAISQVRLRTIPEVSFLNLNNGIPLYYINSGDEDLLRIDFIFDAGQVRESSPLIASTANMMLLEGTENHNAKEINSTFDFYGAYINPFTQKDVSGVTIFLLTKHLEKIAHLCNEILFSPVFPETELENLQKKRLQDFKTNKRKVQTLAYDKFFESVFGPGNPYGKLVTENDFTKVKRDQLLGFHSNYYKNGPRAILVSGKVDEYTRQIINIIFGSRDIEISKKPEEIITVRGNKERKYHVIKEDAVQTAIRIGSAEINRKHPDFNGLMVVDTVLGGYFGSRLMKNLREDKGYTYGIHSSVVSLQQSGYKVITTEVGKDYTGKAIEEIYREIRNLQKYPVEADELNVVKNYMAGEMVRMFDGPFASADSFRAIMDIGFDISYYLDLADKILSIEPDEIMHLASEYYEIDDLYEIVAGPI